MKNALFVGFLTLAITGPALAQRPGRGGPPRGGMGPRPFERWSTMSPDEKKRTLDRLPPDRRRVAEERLDRFEKLPPEEQARLQERYQAFRELSPEKQEEARRLFRQFRQLPDERRDVLRNEFQSLRRMAESERQARINSAEFRDKYSRKEQKLLEGLSGILVEPD